MKAFFLLTLSLCLIYCKAIGQEGKPKHIITTAVFYTSFKPSFYLGYTFQKRQFSLSGRVIGFTDERKANSDNNFPIEKYLDFGIIGGWSIVRHKSFSVSLHTGISYISAVKQGNFLNEEYGWTGLRYKYFEEKRVSTLGVPAEIKVIFPLSKSFGITTIGYANLNGQANTAGVGLGVVFVK